VPALLWQIHIQREACQTTNMQQAVVLTGFLQPNKIRKMFTKLPLLSEAGCHTQLDHIAE
jgi:hypothetical protein